MDLLHLQQQHPTIFAAWAKSDALSGAWMALPTHLSDSAEVAHILWDEFTARSAKRVVVSWLAGAQNLYDPAALARKTFSFLASGHDVGKFSPVFVSHMPELNDGLRKAGLSCPNFTSEERRRAHHSIVSATALLAWLKAKIPDSKAKQIQTLACVLAGHHGRFPDSTQLGAAHPGSRGAGIEPGWQEGREQLFTFAQQLAG